MSLIASIAMSGMIAATTRLQASASNVANMDDVAPLPSSGVAGPKPYAPVRASTISLGDNGVQAQLSANPSASGAAPDPSSPYADAAGMVAMPQVDVGAEMAQQMQALQQYKTSAALLKVQDRMQRTTLDMLA